MSQMKPFAIIINGLKFSVAVVAFMLTIELCTRIDDAIRYDAPLWKTYNADGLKGIDSEGISYNIPNAVFQKWQNNGYGFRGPEIVPAKTPGTVRVVCLGASESYGLYESPGKEWPAQLRTLLQNSKYQIINVSVVGLGLGSYEAYLKKYVLQLEPDIIVCFINPLFYAIGFEKNPGHQVSILKTGATVTGRKPAAPTRKITFSSRCLPKIKQVLKQALQDSLPKVLKSYQVWNLQKQINTAELTQLGGQKPKDMVSANSVASFSHDLSGFVSFLESRKIKVLLATYPALISHDNLAAYPDIFLDNRRFFVRFSLFGMLDVLEKYNSAIRTVAIKHGGKCVDCQAAIPKTDRYFGDNVHYTDQGARLIAEKIAGQILGAHEAPVLEDRTMASH